MREQVITVANNDTKEIVALLFVEEVEYYYIKRRIVAYTTKGIKNDIIAFTESFNVINVNIPTFIKILLEELNSGSQGINYVVLAPYVLISKNKNKSSRNKRILKSLELSEKMERTIFYGGTQDY